MEQALLRGTASIADAAKKGRVEEVPLAGPCRNALLLEWPSLEISSITRQTHM